MITSMVGQTKPARLRDHVALREEQAMGAQKVIQATNLLESNLFDESTCWTSHFDGFNGVGVRRKYAGLSGFGEF